MIISHHLRCIFFAVPKTGTHSVRQALRSHLAADDLEQVGLFVQKRFQFEALRNISHGHISARQIAPVLGSECFASYFKFAFVRNPYDRFVSYCAFMGRENGHFAASPREFMHWLLFEQPPEQHVLFRPQHEFLIDEQGALAMDYIGRSESMQASYATVCSCLGIPVTTLGRANASSHRSYADYYDRRLADGVADRYRLDFKLFGYPFELHANLHA